METKPPNLEVDPKFIANVRRELDKLTKFSIERREIFEARNNGASWRSLMKQYHYGFRRIKAKYKSAKLWQELISRRHEEEDSAPR